MCKVGRFVAARVFHEGKYFSTRSSSDSLPSEARLSTSAPRTPFVFEAIQKTVSGSIRRPGAVSPTQSKRGAPSASAVTSTAPGTPSGAGR